MRHGVGADEDGEIEVVERRQPVFKRRGIARLGDFERRKPDGFTTGGFDELCQRLGLMCRTGHEHTHAGEGFGIGVHRKAPVPMPSKV